MGVDLKLTKDKKSSIFCGIGGFEKNNKPMQISIHIETYGYVNFGKIVRKKHLNNDRFITSHYLFK